MQKAYIYALLCACIIASHNSCVNIKSIENETKSIENRTKNIKKERDQIEEVAAATSFFIPYWNISRSSQPPWAAGCAYCGLFFKVFFPKIKIKIYGQNSNFVEIVLKLIWKTIWLIFSPI